MGRISFFILIPIPPPQPGPNQQLACGARRTSGRKLHCRVYATSERGGGYIHKHTIAADLPIRSLEVKNRLSEGNHRVGLILPIELGSVPGLKDAKEPILVNGFLPRDRLILSGIFPGQIPTRSVIKSA